MTAWRSAQDVEEAEDSIITMRDEEGNAVFELGALDATLCMPVASAHPA